MTTQELLLKRGGHDDNSPDCCAIEAAHVRRGRPKKARALEDESPAIVAFFIAWNDSFPNTREGDADRTKYCGPLLDRVAGSRRSIEMEIRRSWMAADWLLRVYTPICLEQLEELKPHAEALRATAEIVDAGTLRATVKVHKSAARAALDASASAAFAARDARDALAARAALAALATLDARAARAAFAALAARDAIAALAAIAAFAALAALAARAARDAIAARDGTATKRERHQAAVAAATKVYVEFIPRVRAAEVDLIERMFALTEQR